jgi:hypothetical protein
MVARKQTGVTPARAQSRGVHEVRAMGRYKAQSGITPTSANARDAMARRHVEERREMDRRHAEERRALGARHARERGWA